MHVLNTGGDLRAAQDKPDLRAITMPDGNFVTQLD
jgi:hypothetical protein